MIEEFKEYVLKLNKELCIKEDYEDAEDILKNGIWHGYVPPLDSVDRVFALFILDCHPELLDVNIEEITKTMEIGNAWYDGLSKEVRELNEYIMYIAYDNYEREGITNTVAYGNIIAECQKGREWVLKSSYGSGGWFGAS